ncbi:substrate-binding domain-containing protein [Pedobacter riviphilus]|uniref:Substrate-binding domain-containing protein n=1 Tax=Pedobacter riviphilus TaxID=2766984 RepID=A0ABX6TJR6_9SPHI|nr:MULTISPECIES: substrate-binding domain-containing protein [Pedobacter]NII84827.1 phosphate transport system substrate-binding protein [Pedobacter sp. SG908]NMN38265.1 phosphate transport system substrate-binding protein [Pedobacter sp. SG918]QNR84620.1 substrate-binding domain-containing protein [Pedobacter riviphilus]
MKNFLLIFCVLALLVSCKRKNKANAVKETRTSGTLKILVDESVGPIVQDQIDIFSLDYPDAKFQATVKPEEKLLPAFLNDSVRVIVLPRLLTKAEEKYYNQRNIKINTSRFAVDGIALITNQGNIDSTINVKDVIDILQGKKSDKKLVFDNAYSSTFQYFKELANINQFPATGVYSKNSSKEVIKLIAEDKNFIGILGVNWITGKDAEMSGYLSQIKVLGVKNVKGKVGDDQFYKPTQDNLINGVYPFLRNINIIDCEGRDGLGTGFATWLRSQRGQLIVLKSGLGPHKLMPREINLTKESNK